MRHQPGTTAMLFAALLGFVPVAADAQDSDAPTQAQAAARAWLAVVDAGDYVRSWGDAAGLLQAAIGRTQWVQQLAAVRAPLGAVAQRRVKSIRFTRTLPGAPEGEYVVIDYDSVFDALPAATETLTPVKDKDGSWKVAGYFIR